MISSAAVVLLRDIFRASLFLILSFLAVAGIYILLAGRFPGRCPSPDICRCDIGASDIRHHADRDTQQGNPSNRLSAPGAFLAGVIFSAIIVAIFTTDWPLSSETPPESTTELLADALFNRFVLPFEVASVLLLAAMIGAIVIARPKEADGND